MKNIHIILLTIIIIISCSKNSDSPVDTQMPSEPILQNSVYVYLPDNGKLPYPHHNPSYTKAQYDSMMNQLFIINNFGLWQGGAERNSQYFHDGIDIVTKNGTKIFAIEDGYVRAILGSTEYYKSLYIEDKDEPGYVWGYTHIYNFKVEVGQEVKQGDLLATVNFQGVEHIHLSRSKLIKDAPWNSYYSYENIAPDKYFNYADNEAPVIKTPFYFFYDRTNSLVSDAPTPVLNGKIDIVVGIRDQGEHAKGPIGNPLYNFGDRLCVSRIEYKIKRENSDEEIFKSFDFSKISFVFRSDQYEKVEIAYKSRYLMEESVTSYDRVFSYYIITNWKDRDSFKEFDYNDSIQCWDTTQLNSDGSQKYPNGTYLITVVAYDYAGNSTQQEQTVIVNN